MNFFFIYDEKKPCGTVAYENKEGETYYGITVLSRDDELDIRRGIEIAGGRCKKAIEKDCCKSWEKYYRRTRKFFVKIGLGHAEMTENPVLCNVKRLGFNKLGYMSNYKFQDKIKELY